ncbi:hypothetical protein DFA_10426 [Cavenderia fasciculata]|uniref:Uncharacterized protein n=1 Tax=Cavenderia fasciculata TaxID=261658 RepID=F4QA65_CACFS|nr:uncharacterized protein DFA_10426 [Cavenderia fasciculata]EGG15584.1 hypothetical protein DFA_10426 [Cavenderia fasciculata]|eukprot:XP_004354326.1 hypothetical protein DFA_10426 [Cavenderia fasciculata]
MAGRGEGASLGWENKQVVDRSFTKDTLKPPKISAGMAVVEPAALSQYQKDLLAKIKETDIVYSRDSNDSNNNNDDCDKDKEDIKHIYKNTLNKL